VSREHFGDIVLGIPEMRWKCGRPAAGLPAFPSVNAIPIADAGGLQLAQRVVAEAGGTGGRLAGVGLVGEAARVTGVTHVSPGSTLWNYGIKPQKGDRLRFLGAGLALAPHTG